MMPSTARLVWRSISAWRTAKSSAPSYVDSIGTATEYWREFTPIIPICGHSPPQEEPEISSPLRWTDVILPAPVTEADLDRIIFSKLGARLMKTARIVGDVAVECERLAWPIPPDVIGARIEELAEQDRIDSEGDLRYWRHSEIRLKP
jgi:hypothetical protein